MKRKYDDLELEIVKFDIEDVIRTSNGGDESSSSLGEDEDED